jgi:hypothetical protein
MSKYVSDRIKKIAKDNGCRCSNSYLEYSELIEWIFNFEKHFQIYHLEYWYNTLIPELINIQTFNIRETNKSALGILNEWLMSWFEEQGYVLVVFNSHFSINCIDKDNDILDILNLYCINGELKIISQFDMFDYKMNNNKDYEKAKIVKYKNTNQARHNGILNIFEVIKNNI